MKWKNLACTTTYFVTATITRWRPLLAQDQPRSIVLADLDFYRRKYSSKIMAYVIMPEHYHLVVRFVRPEDLHPWLHDMQSHTSNEMGKWLRRNASPEELEVLLLTA